MYKVFTYVILGLCAAVAHAQECQPVYSVEYNTCPTGQKTMDTVVTDWILVNKGARTVTNALCEEHIPQIAAQDRNASHIVFHSLDNRDATHRGIGKRDVYCKFQMDTLVPVRAPHPGCGIKDVRANCFTNVSKAYVMECAQGPIGDIEAMWKKAACLIDAQKNLALIIGRDAQMLDAVDFEFKVLVRTLEANRGVPEYNQLLSWIRPRSRN